MHKCVAVASLDDFRGARELGLIDDNGESWIRYFIRTGRLLTIKDAGSMPFFLLNQSVRLLAYPVFSTRPKWRLPNMPAFDNYDAEENTFIIGTAIVSAQDFVKLYVRRWYGI